MSFDLVPNEGNFYLPPVDEEQEAALKKERAEANQVIPFLDDVIAWFDKQADEYEKVTAIDLKSGIDPVVQMKAHQEVVKVLRMKKGELTTYLDAYKR